MKKVNKLLTLFIFLFTLCSNLAAEAKPPRNKKEFIILGSREAGLFSMFNDVLALLICYEKGYYRGIEVDFGTNGLYYVPEHGTNWWSYYCEPIVYGEKVNIRKIVGDPPFTKPSQAEKHTSRNKAFEIIQKYFFFKPFIQEKINNFERDNFSGKYVIGVHYRGTDKIKEATPVSYQTVFNQIKKRMKSQPGYDYKIFVATDEQNFIDEIKLAFGEDIVCYNKDALRATDNAPLHISQKYDHFKCGADAIIDSLLLSKSDYLIRMSSNLSLWSTFFNPNLEVTILNKRR